VRECYIVEGVRSPIGKKNGSLQNVRTDELAGLVLKELASRSGVNTNLIEHVIMGSVVQIQDQAFCLGRQAALIAGYPYTVPGCTIDQACGSSMQAIHFGAQAILSGDQDCVVAAGAENMTRCPMGSNYKDMTYSTKITDHYEIVPQGMSAEYVAEKYNLSRQELDELAAASHERAATAREKGWFKKEIVPVEITLPDGTKTMFEDDECIRPGTTVEKLATLKPVFREDGVIHAGNSSQISAGAAAVMLMSGEKVKELGLKPKFKIIARSVIGSHPTLMLTGPIPATQMALKKAGLTINDIDVYEVNEAFAPVPLAWLKETGADPAKLNPVGSGISLGHPLGATGARLIITLMYEMERIGAKYGLATLCEAWGQANATILERVN
jgi:acetyl-CoA acyltransferase